MRNEATTECLLCSKQLKNTMSWNRLLTFAQGDVICPFCKSEFRLLNDLIEDVFCIFEYNDAMKVYIQKYKFQGDYILARVFGEEIKKAIHLMEKQLVKKGTVNPKSIVVPIPLHESKQRQRKFSQVHSLLDCAGIAYEDLLIKRRDETQSLKTREERLKVKDLFSVKQEVVDGNIIVFDDIKTTGATLREAKMSLLHTGAREVNCVTLAAVL